MSRGVTIMSRISKSRLLATSAIVGLSIVHLSAAAQAQQAFGIQNDQEETLDIIVAEGETVEGDDAGVYAQEGAVDRSEEHTSELQSLMRISYAVFCLKKKKNKKKNNRTQVQS